MDLDNSLGAPMLTRAIYKVVKNRGHGSQNAGVGWNACSVGSANEDIGLR